MSDIQVKNLNVIFGKRKKEALKLLNEGYSKADILDKTGCTVGVYDASLDIKEGEIFVVMGLSGSGKSTLLRCFNRLIDPTSGSIEMDGRDIIQTSDAELREIRRKKMTMVFQHFGLLPHRTVSSNVAFGLEIQGVDEETRIKTAYETIETVGLKGYEEQMTGQLSGGMQQRVGLARALATNPEVLLMDEAFSALDPLIRTNMQDELLQLQEKVHKTILFITHDLDEALKLGDRIAIMKDGKVVQVGTPEEILTNPADDYVKAFVENVDRGDIVTARSIMFEKPDSVRIDHDGPKIALRKMRKHGVTSLPVVDTQNTFLGFVKDTEMVEMEEKGLDKISEFMHTKKEVTAVSPETPVSELLPLFLDNIYNMAVVDDNKKLLGVVVHSSVISEMIGIERKEVVQLKEDGGVDL
ncbi:Glycine betaine/carnitine transport ATP-binding protein GbuA [Salinivirga cyanobacteriivorans]|uniref:Glycine betaine/carnitine transport ATP-binding protein GbuA n=1 Tax=Salinivirga cyanobacteriivorans TaxID=1307839 RepID=A0A0S2HVS3_9BACT|nr:glycine betaine/L-proline ABC transporter ATP-binding protein [Salinivirga cyanobacteriivorans]ALO14151.1 Glycine betaine/carnitine transport ATP-binding protein GbuA [Salinivirga cyanobacteriivorans]